MKKYILEPFVEQTYSVLINQNNNYNAEKTVNVLDANKSDDPSNITQVGSFSRNIGVNINSNDQQSLSINVLNGLPLPTTTTNYTQYMKPFNMTNPLYPVGINNGPTTKIYKLSPTKSPISSIIIPSSNILIYFFIGIFCILLIFVLVFYFLL